MWSTPNGSVSWRKRFCCTKVKDLEQSNSSRWWQSVKHISGLKPSSGRNSVLSPTDEIDGLDDHAAANLINTAFLDPMKAYQKINTLPSVLPSSTSHRPPLTLSEVDVLSALTELSSKKPGRWPRWNSMLGAQRVC